MSNSMTTEDTSPKPIKIKKKEVEKEKRCQF